MLRYAVAAAFLVSTITPAMAEWYIVKNKAENKCRTTETKPDGENVVMVGTATYATKDEAKKARNAMTDECPGKDEDKDKDKDKDKKEG